MIIVEGPDNAGKSTLMKTLLGADPRLRVLHRDKFNPKRAETIAVSYLRALIPVDGDRVAHGYSVADRFFASECIYGSLYRNGCRMTEGEHMAIRLMLISYNALIVHCDPGDIAITRSWKDREQLYDRDPLEIANAYRTRMPLVFRGRQIIRYSYIENEREGQMPIDAIVASHQVMMANRATTLSRWSAVPWGVGQLRSPKIVIVGEALAPNAQTQVPFANGHAGDYLARTLNRVEQRLPLLLYPLLEDVYITNADKQVPHSMSILREELRNLDLPPDAIIIMLGQVAGAAVSYIKDALPPTIKTEALPHPSHWRRFHSKSPEAYDDAMLLALASYTPRIDR